MHTSRTLSIISNEFGEGSVGNVEVEKSFRCDDILLTFRLEMPSTSKSRGNLVQRLEAEWRAFLEDTLGLTSGSSFSETTGSQKHIGQDIQTGQESLD